MECFLNELSLEAQYGDVAAFEAAVLRLTRLVRTATGHPLFRSEALYGHRALATQDVRATLSRLSREAQYVVKAWLFDRSNPEDWQPTRLSLPDEAWTCLGRDISDSSMGEAAVRVQASRSVVLFNFAGSWLQDVHPASCIPVLGEPVAVPCFDDAASLERWIERLPGTRPYRAWDADPPRDEQTCLVQTERFRATPRTFQGRRVYEERTTGDQWYVDNLHVGEAAELEVFDKFGRHKGTWSLDGSTKTGSPVPGRRLGR